ncbi:MAG: transglutaminase domain-containing protein [Deltaproteobacteria bacterium]|nr:MAG: transglutaminase domain-containing protein [Deltaproteobacteria bacterium]
MLSEWPPTEYWTGIVFNGARIGFSHFKLNPAEGHSDLYDIHSEAYFHIRFLMFDKRIKLKSFDRVGNDLSLIRFYYEYDLDGNKLGLKGRKIDNQLEVEILTRGQIHRQIIPLSDKIYPTSVITLYPVMHGLAVDRRYTYLVYDGETKSIATVKQDVLAYEESDLFPGQAFRVHTRLHGHSVNSWIDSQGRPLLEMSLGGVIISTLESKKKAQKYLTTAAINKDEALRDFSLIKTNVAIDNPSGVTSMEVVLSGLSKSATLAFDQRQQCQRREENFFCRTNTQIQKGAAAPSPVDADHISRYLQPSFSVPSRNPLIHQLANNIVKDTRETLHRIESLLEWIQDNIEQKPTDVFTALDVLEDRKAECQGHSLLYTAFARALTIPTRVVNGVVYSKNHRGFLYHTWAESLVDDRWIAVDPTFKQIPADATHIKLIEGELMSDLLPLADLIGNLEIQILAVRDQQTPPR